MDERVDAAGAAASEEMMDLPRENPSMGDPTIPDASTELFQCCVCLDLLYKPIVLACGHISCFWCVHKAMNGLQESHCAICRQPYKYFPGICQLLHLLLLKIEPVAYKRREKEVLEEEKELHLFSPQFVDRLTTETVYASISSADKSISSTLAEPLECKNVEATEKADVGSSETNKSMALEELPESGLKDGIYQQVCVSDVLCAGCKHLLFRPAVLNCGHVYCEPCLVSLMSETLRCQVCQSLHPGDLPRVCLEFEHFLEKQFPKEYALRRVPFQPSPLKGSLQTKKHDDKPDDGLGDALARSREEMSNTHYGVGCDSCGMFPIIGKRYKCKDCKEAVGFDLCGACFNTRSKLLGRFNQQHTPDHTFVLDESHMLGNIWGLREPTQDLHQDPPAIGRWDSSEDPENPDSIL